MARSQHASEASPPQNHIIRSSWNHMRFDGGLRLRSSLHLRFEGGPTSPLRAREWLLPNLCLAVPGLLLLGLLNYLNCRQLLLARAALPATVAGNSAYSAVVGAALGRAGVATFEGSICVTLVLVCASLQVQSAQLLAATTGAAYATCVGAVGAILVPLVLMRTLDKLAWVAAGGLIALSVSLLAVGAYGVARFGPPTWPPPAALGELQPPPSALALFFGIASFSFGVQVVLLPVQDGMAHPEDATRAVAVSIAFVAAAYILVGLLLAWIFEDDPQGVQQLILLNRATTANPTGRA